MSDDWKGEGLIRSRHASHPGADDFEPASKHRRKISLIDARAAAEDGLSMAATARLLRVTRSAIRQFSMLHEIKFSSGRGQNRPQKITPEQAAKALADGASAEDVAKAYGVTPRHVRRIARRAGGVP